MRAIPRISVTAEYPRFAPEERFPLHRVKGAVFTLRIGLDKMLNVPGISIHQERSSRRWKPFKDKRLVCACASYKQHKKVKV